MAESNALPLLRGMRPGDEANDVVYRLHGARVFASKLMLGNTSGVAFANLAYLRPGKSRQSVMLTPVALVIANTVRPDILSARTPAKVSEAGVQLATGTMPGFLSLRAQANECFEHQVMHEPLNMPTVSSTAELNFGVAIVPDVLADDIASSPATVGLAPDGPYLAEVADFVQALPVGNRQPSFVHVDDNTPGCVVMPNSNILAQVQEAMKQHLMLTHSEYRTVSQVPYIHIRGQLDDSVQGGIMWYAWCDCGWGH